MSRAFYKGGRRVTESYRDNTRPVYDPKAFILTPSVTHHLIDFGGVLILLHRSVSRSRFFLSRA